MAIPRRSRDHRKRDDGGGIVTVAELIEKLRALPQDAEVLVDNYDRRGVAPLGSIDCGEHLRPVSADEYVLLTN